MSRLWPASGTMATCLTPASLSTRKTSSGHVGKAGDAAASADLAATSVIGPNFLRSPQGMICADTRWRGQGQEYQCRHGFYCKIERPGVGGRQGFDGQVDSYARGPSPSARSAVSPSR